MTVNRWHELAKTPMPVNRDIDVLHTTFGLLKNCVYYPEKLPFTLQQQDAHFKINEQVTHWRFAEEKVL